jgi:(p)ppGpp synthase/HD superfamily hydrolase
MYIKTEKNSMMQAKLAMAIKLASEVFVNKTDKAGKPYILHCLRVMNAVNQNDPELMQIAVLHDVVEDTHITIADLQELGFSNRVCNAIYALTHVEGENYEDYIKGIAMNIDAKAVKRADLIDNSNITRLKGLRKKDFDRLEKYHKAFVYLTD